MLRDAHPGRAAGVAVGRASDHAPFADAGIAVSGFYTGSAERGPGGRARDPCYHRPCDRPENVDRRVLVRMARATVTVLREVDHQP